MLYDLKFTENLASWNRLICDTWPLNNQALNLPVDSHTIWLWKLDPAEECSVTIPMNTCQLFGLILARVCFTANSHVTKVDSNLTLVDKHLCEFSLRDLRNSMQHMQVEWIRGNLAAMPDITAAVDGLFATFGRLTMTASSVCDIMNDQGSVEQLSDDDTLVMMNAACLCRFLNLFLVMYRHIYVHSHLQPMQNSCSMDDIDPTTSAPHVKETGIKKHHVYAGVDDFHILSMNWDLMMGAKLIYMHDFSGMYNCVSQVVYFHQSEYERRPTCLEPVDAVATGVAGDTECAALYTLPSILQLYPEITVTYEECSEIFDGKWHWLLMGRRVFLVSPEAMFYYDSNITALLRLYMNHV
jgi:hypothetical protein